MHLSTSDDLVLSRSHHVVYLRLLARISHGFWAVVAGCLTAFYLPSETGVDPGNLLKGMLVSGIIAAVVFEASGLYGDSMFNCQLRLKRLIHAWLLSFILILLVREIAPALAVLSRTQMACWFALALGLLGSQRLATHFLFGRLVQRGVGFQNMVILGRTASGSRLAEFIRKNADIRSHLAGYVDDRQTRGKHPMAGLAYLGNTDDLKALVRAGKVQQILIALPWSAGKRVGEFISSLRQLPVHLLLAPDMVALHYARHRIVPVAGLPMFNISDPPLRGWSPLVKRAEDIVLVVAALLLCAPVMLLLAVLIKLDSPGPVLFRQKRYGYNNRLIEVYKFRSMFVEMTDPHAENQTTRNDPRVTRVGRFIRKTSLDELPQLLNVLGGSMSMVGPRPHAAATKAAGVLFEDAVDEYTSRHRVKPGITGWAQVNGFRGETDTLEKIEKRVAHDLEYIENWSLWFDLYILARTPLAVLGAKEAY